MPLTVPVLAIGGAESAGRGSGRRWSSPPTTCTRVIPNCSHFVAGEAPRQLLAALIPLLTA